jgi:DNA-binding IclR family transcriptional regulator
MIECGNMSATKLKNEIGVLLLDEPMSLKEVAAAMGIKEKKAYNLLKSMFTDERVISFKDADGERRYRVTEEEADKAQKRKARSEKK